MRQLLQYFCSTRCFLCDLECNGHQLICDDCYRTLPICHNACKQCGIQLTQNSNRCTQCITSPPSFHRTFSLFNYQPPISQWITQLKFQENLIIAKLFAQYWINYFKNQRSELPELILPVPLHYRRLKERGFNQAVEIAKPIGKHFQIPVAKNMCVKIKNTEAQSNLSAEKRRKNLKNAFALSYSIDAKRVAILDDVMTTGNTVSEISALLQKTGVEHIDIWCCARAQ